MMAMDDEVALCAVCATPKHTHSNDLNIDVDEGPIYGPLPDKDIAKEWCKKMEEDKKLPPNDKSRIKH